MARYARVGLGVGHQERFALLRHQADDSLADADFVFLDLLGDVFGFGQDVFVGLMQGRERSDDDAPLKGLVGFVEHEDRPRLRLGRLHNVFGDDLERLVEVDLAGDPLTELVDEREDGFLLLLGLARQDAQLLNLLAQVA